MFNDPRKGLGVWSENIASVSCKILNVRGTSGAGKTHSVRTFMEQVGGFSPLLSASQYERGLVIDQSTHVGTASKALRKRAAPDALTKPTQVL